jgi:NADH dehydrogenase
LFFIRKFVPSAEITIFDRNNYLLYTPVLHEMSTGTVDARHLVVPIRKTVNPREVKVRCEEVTGVDLSRKAFQTPAGRFEFDSLVLAHGSEPNFYCFQNLKENCFTFKTMEDAIRLRNRLIDVLERAALERDPGRRRRLLTLTVAGGGCTGVELVAEIAQFINLILHKDYPEIERSEVRILLLEAMERILPSFSSYLSQVAMERLMRMGIDVRLNAPIQGVGNDWIDLKDERIPNGILIWTGGVKARDLLLQPHAERDLNNRILVDEHLEIPGFSQVYVIGDAAHSGDGSALPPTASVAVQEARYVARSISLHAQGWAVPPFRFKHRGDMASLGFMFGVSEIYGRQFKGFPAWAIWKAFKLMMLPRYKNRLQIVADWLITLLFKRDTSKLM